MCRSHTFSFENYVYDTGTDANKLFIVIGSGNENLAIPGYSLMKFQCPGMLNPFPNDKF